MCHRPSERTLGDMKSIRTTATILATAAAAVAMFTTTAAHAVEFPPNPSVTINTVCHPDTGAAVQVGYHNDGGLDNALFSTSIDGVAQAQVNLIPDQIQFVDYNIADNHTAAVVISAAGMQDVTVSAGPIDCHQGTANLVLTCVGDVPTLTGTATNTGQSNMIAELTVNGDFANTQSAPLKPGESVTLTKTIPDDTDVDALFGFQNGGGLPAEVRDHPHCVIPTTTTVIVTTTSVSAEVPTTPPAGLPVTGKASGAVAALGGALTLLGFGTIRLARRPRRA